MVALPRLGRFDVQWPKKKSTCKPRGSKGSAAKPTAPPTSPVTGVGKGADTNGDEEDGADSEDDGGGGSSSDDDDVKGVVGRSWKKGFCGPACEVRVAFPAMEPARGGRSKAQDNAALSARDRYQVCTREGLDLRDGKVCV